MIQTKVNVQPLLKAAVLGFSLSAACALEPTATNGWVDVSHGIGVPVCTLGSGYSVFGKFGFVRVNYDKRPDNVPYKPGGPYAESYTRPAAEAKFGFILTDGTNRYVLQSATSENGAPPWAPGAKSFEADAIQCHACLPKGRVVFAAKDLDVQTTVETYSPMLPHDLDTASTPVQIYDVTLQNNSDESKTVRLQLQNAAQGKASGNTVVFTDRSGELAFGVRGGTADEHGVGVTVKLPAHHSGSARFIIGWYYPHFDVYGGRKADFIPAAEKQAVSGPAPTNSLAVRYYTKHFHNASEVVALGLKRADAWSRAIGAWHDSLQVPGYFKKVWFNSLATMTSAMLTTNAYFLIETPHSGLNTMDVDAYNSWVCLINWPELERMDMDEHIACIPTNGPAAGTVLHSLPHDRAHYVVEPTFIARFYRDSLWFNDRAWTKENLHFAGLAAQHVYDVNHYEHLINSPHGTQSYDIWRMPGVSAYVNSPWIYGLYGLDRLSRRLGEPVVIGGEGVADFWQKAATEFDSILWNARVGDWNLFFRTPDAAKDSTPDATFTDQLFGRWMLEIDPGADAVLPADKVVKALHTVYTNNLLDSSEKSFRGWANGMLPGRRPDLTTGYHARTCWFGAQINLGCLLGLVGDEDAALDVFKSIETSMHGNVLAAGEWNGEVNRDGGVDIGEVEAPKDTPRFPPYPRYQSSWAELPCLLGLQMDERTFYVNPFHNLDFNFKSVQLAGTTFTVHVQSGWTKALLNGKPAAIPVRVPRTMKSCRIDFVH